MKTYHYRMRDGWGEIQSTSLHDAYRSLRYDIRPAEIADGETLYVEDRETAESITMPGVISYTASTHEDWDADQDGAPVCRTETTVTLLVDGEPVATGTASGYYCHCVSGGDRHSHWQDGDGPERDRHWDEIAGVLALAGVIESEWALDDCISHPAEPAPPAQDPAGGYVILYHGWEQPWQVRGRYADEADAGIACRMADRRTREACGPNAYGWGWAVGMIVDDGGEMIDGLRVQVLDCE